MKRERETWSELPYRLYTSCTISHAALRLSTPRTEAMQARIPAARAWPPRSRGPGTVPRHHGDPVQGPECTPPAWPGSMRPFLAQPIRYLSVTVPRPRRREASRGFLFGLLVICAYGLTLARKDTGLYRALYVYLAGAHMARLRRSDGCALVFLLCVV